MPGNTINQQSPSRHSNRTFIIIFALLAVISVIYGILNFRNALPEIAIEFEITNHEAAVKAREFLEGRNFELEGYKESTIFTYNTIVRLYLEQELGVNRTVTLSRDSLDVWYWQTRFFKPLENLEYKVNIDPHGSIIGFDRKLPDNIAGASLDKDVARILAEAFLTGPMGIDLDEWDSLDPKSIDRQVRHDHDFTYEWKDFKAGEAPYRMVVSVQGAAVGAFQRYLKVPEKWLNSYVQQRDQNNRFQIVAMFITLLITFVAVILLIKNTKSGQIPWKVAAIVGVVLAAVNVIMGINSLPLEVAAYQTTESYGAFIGRIIIFSLLNGLLMGLLVMMLIGSGEPLYRRAHPTKLFLPSIFSRRGFRTREFAQATLVGYLLAGFHFGFVVFFYLMGKKIGIWSPAEIRYDNAVSTALPWIFPLTISMSAALVEEFGFRMFGISFFRRIFRSNIIAVIIPAILWGFLHSNYPQEPGYVRGIEIGVIGICAGIVMLRFGIWATLVWHFVIDALWTGLFLFQSGSGYLWISGLIVCSGLAAPALFAAIQRLKHRKFDSAEDMLNQTHEHPPSSQMLKTFRFLDRISPKETIQSTLSNKARHAALFIGSLGILAVLLTSAPTLNDEYSPLIDREEAILRAKTHLSETYGIDAEKFKVVAVDNGYRMKNDHYRNWFRTKLSYVKRYGTLDEAREIFFSPLGVSLMMWMVVFKQELDPEEYFVHINQLTGEIYISHYIPEFVSGTKLESDSSLALATEAFQWEEVFHPKYRLVGDDPRKREKRRDHYLTWETYDPVIGDAHYRRNVAVIGDEVEVGWRRLKVPEEWERSELSRSVRWVVLQVLGIALIFGGFVLITVLRRRLPRMRIRWKPGFYAGGLMFIIAALSVINRLPAKWWDYNSNQSYSSYLTQFGLTSILEIIFMSLLTLIVVTLAGAFISDRFSFTKRDDSVRFKLSTEESFISLLGILGLVLGFTWLIANLTGWLDLPQHSFNLHLPEHLSTTFPWFGEFTAAIKAALTLAPIVMILFLLMDVAIGKSWQRLLAIILLAVSYAGFSELNAGNPTNIELAWSVVRTFVFMSVGYLAMKHWIVGRLIVLMAAVFSLKLISSAIQFLEWEGSPYQDQGWLLILLALPPISWFFIKSMRTG